MAKITFWVMWLLSLSFPGFAAQELRVSLLLFNGIQRTAYSEQLAHFARENPDIELVIKNIESETYKRQIDDWLAATKHSDVMYWFSGERLRWFVDQGKIRALDALWAESGWGEQFTLAAQSSVTFNDQKYGVPMHYYPWAIYYNKSLFQSLNIPVPDDWEAFIQACSELAKNGITPIVMGSEDKWALAAWFAHLNLRINGLEFYQELMAGKISYKDQRVLNVFKHWEELIRKDYFIRGHEILNWKEAVPYIYREKGGMILLGNFWTSQIPASMRDNIGIVRFPVINQELPLYEQAPTDVLIIPQNVKNLAGAEKLLQFMARPDVQKELNDAIGMIAPNTHHVETNDQLLEDSYKILENATGLAQFYDRDSPEPFATEGMLQLARFVADPDVLPDVLDKLEQLNSNR